MTELVWDGKYSADGKRIAPVRVALPFQTVETVNESAQERQLALDVFAHGTPLRNPVDQPTAVGVVCLYYPDFVAWLESGEHWLLETKGQENVDVARKDAAATLWCENATALTGVTWRYLKVGQKAFANLQPHDFTDLLALASRN